MKTHEKKRTAGAVLAVILVCFVLMSQAVFASEKIDSVTLRFSIEDYDSRGYPEVEVEISSSNYSCTDAVLAYDFYEGDDATQYEGKDTVYAVELTAEDGYYFNVTSSKKISVRGLGAEFIKASRKDSGTTLIVVVDLKDAYSQLGEIDEAKWTDECKGSWEETQGSDRYVLQMTNPAGKVIRVETYGTTYDFSPYMLATGTYTYKVKPANEHQSGAWTDGGSTYISPERADSNKDRFEVKKNITYDSDYKEPSSMHVEYTNTGWQKENGHYWYRNEDGSYPQSNWLCLDDAWYWCDENGYRVENDYVTVAEKTYYFGENGVLYVNKKAPDGRSADENGVLS